MNIALEQKLHKAVKIFNDFYPNKRARKKNRHLLYELAGDFTNDEQLDAILKETTDKTILSAFTEFFTEVQDARVREVIAGNLNVPANIMWELRNDEDKVQIELISNPSIPLPPIDTYE